MFKEEYLLELLSGKLSEKGYANILGSIAAMVKCNQWQKSIIVSANPDSNWNNEDIKELAHMYFEWVIINDKLKYLEKVPYEYLSYYFTQMLVSFVANRIKEEQQKVGISYQKCLELVKQICEEEYDYNIISGKKYIKSPDCSSDKVIEEITDIVKYMPHIPINESTRQFKPIVRMTIDDVLMNANGNISTDNLCKAVFELLDQTTFMKNETDYIDQEELEDSSKYNSAIKTIISGISKTDAAMFLEYIFQDNKNISLADIAAKYSLPKSSAHKKIEDFKGKIISTYMPENDNDGVAFLQNLANCLDEISK